MLKKFIRLVGGDPNRKEIEKLSDKIALINRHEAELERLSDEALYAQSAEYKALIDQYRSDITDQDERKRAEQDALEEILPGAFALVREASKRTIGLRHFDVQLIGGMVLHQGKIAEMRTGEGKTLVATLPAYLNTLAGKGVHVVTVNDYLASRDAEWMGRVYRFLGLSVGVNLSQMEHELKQQAYLADITYGTNSEFGFDYLRDNMVFQTSERVQRGLSYAIVDEVDSILIDEARTPLIISGQAEDSTELYYRMNEIVPKLTRVKEENGPGDFTVDEKAHQVLLTEAGHERAEELMTRAGLLPENGSLYDAANINLMHHLYAALRANSLFHRDQHYVAQNDEIIIVDEFTGRLTPGRRWSDGLHQAIEAKEGVRIQRENQTLASITYQNYFRMYHKLAGMTGTADTEAYEFQQIYGLETVIIPTHMPMIREDRLDQVYRTAQEKYTAVINDIRNCHQSGQPVLVGTTSIENSELLAKLLEKEKLPHQVLNAKQHAREAEIIAQAGRPNMVTIATNMAGRGTDIVLGGNPEPDINKIRNDSTIPDQDKDVRVSEMRLQWQNLHEQVIRAGGLHIVGTERHESRRVDNQLRGRSGRQGDPGSSRFYLSLEDPLLRIFASDRVAAIMDRLKMPEGEAIEHPWVTRAIENAQRKVEARNFDIRKQLLEYDDVANDQRKVIYQQRNELLEATDISDTIRSMREGTVHAMVSQRIPPGSVEEQWDVPGLERTLAGELGLRLSLQEWLKQEENLDEEHLVARILDAANEVYEKKFSTVDDEKKVRDYERAIMLNFLDSHWREHLSALDHLRQGIHLRGYAQKNPKQEYKREAFELFSLMLDTVRTEVTGQLMLVQIQAAQEVESVVEKQEHTELRNVQYHQNEDPDEALEKANAEVKVQPYVRGQKIGRNDPCPCGSGRKYKQCHGKLG